MQGLNPSTIRWKHPKRKQKDLELGKTTENRVDAISSLSKNTPKIRINWIYHSKKRVFTGLHMIMAPR